MVCLFDIIFTHSGQFLVLVIFMSRTTTVVNQSPGVDNTKTKVCGDFEPMKQLYGTLDVAETINNNSIN